ncbi:hypothetical protein G4B88_018621 [Cannabis sativa]|uniref:Uncharacterized protein n=1 Tax=Cannabis sativa TaxID=3483 RepID=A0A7J6HHN4_CANSA|nr:hypothetical protein G4B88_018621 [Cannabis sativa]
MGDPSDSSSGEEDGDVAWRAAIDSVATTTSTYVSSIINGSSDMAAKQRLTSADDGNDCRNQKLKHYQIKTHISNKGNKGLINFLHQMLMLHCSNKWKLASFGGLRMANLFSCTFHCLISQKAIILWTYDPCERDAKLAREALENSKKSVEHLKMILLVAVVSSFRYDRDEVDSAIANLEASRLHEAIKIKQLDDDHMKNRYLPNKKEKLNNLTCKQLRSLEAVDA